VRSFIIQSTFCAAANTREIGMTRNSVALLGLFSIFVTSFIFTVVRELIKSQEIEMRKLIEDLSFIADHPLQVGMMMILLIILFSFKMKWAATLLCIFSIIFISFYETIGELMGELRETVSYIAAHPRLFWMLITIKIIALLWFVSEMQKRLSERPISNIRKRISKSPSFSDIRRRISKSPATSGK
jgi:hypothetical protein